MRVDCCAQLTNKGCHRCEPRYCPLRSSREIVDRSLEVIVFKAGRNRLSRRALHTGHRLHRIIDGAQAELLSIAVGAQSVCARLNADAGILSSTFRISGVTGIDVAWN